MKNTFGERLNWLETFYEERSKEDASYRPNLTAVRLVKEEFSHEIIFIENVDRAIDIYNETTSKKHRTGNAWDDFGLYLCYIAKLNGIRLKVDADGILVRGGGRSQ